jgi:hypothetical protein
MSRRGDDNTGLILFALAILFAAAIRDGAGRLRHGIWADVVDAEAI